MSLKKLLLLMVISLVSLCSFAQVSVTGVVISSDDNEPVIGASIKVKEKPSIGTTTDIDGKFTLNVPSAKSHLEVSYVGHGTKVVAVTPGTPLKVVLTSKSTTLGEVEVVATGMQKIDRRLFTGATAKVDADKAKLSGVADISRGLEGKVAGVQVQNVTGTFGTAPKIRVRGATSIYGTSKPLWVVDGVVLEDAVDVSADDLSSGDAVTLISSAIAGLNADDIESFQVLKDGSATSIYGAKAMAGVIVVTTKSGKAGHTSINYTGEFTYRLKPSYNEYNICNSQEQMGIYKEMEQKGWLEFSSLAKASNTGIYGHMYGLINSYENGSFGMPNTTAAKNAYLREAEFRNTNWFDLLFNNNIMQNHAVSISGGTDRGNFYTSMSLMNDPGWYKSSRVERYTFNANAQYRLTDKIKVKILTSDSYRKQKAPGTLSQDVDAVNGEVKRSFDINPFSYAMNTSRTLDPNTTYKRNYSNFNIFDELQQNYIDINVQDLKFQGELNITPIKGLDINLLGSYRYSSSDQNHYVKDNSNQALAYRAGIDPEDALIRSSNSYLYTDPDDANSLPISVLPKGGILYFTQYSVAQYDFRGTAQYNTVLGGKHTINVLGGMEASKVQRHQEAFQGWGIVYNNGRLPFTRHELFKQMQEENGSYFSDQFGNTRNLAYFGTGTYSFMGRYMLVGTLRYEGSNKMGKTHQSRWLPTWNVSAGWNIYEEPWFKKWSGNKYLSYAKLRASYSLTAESGPSSYANAEALYYPSRPWRQESDAQELGLAISALANSDLTYEKKHELDLGVDLGFFGNRLNLVFDWYKRNNFDLIGRMYNSGVGGFSTKFGNVAEMAAHGVEFTISSRNITNDSHDRNGVTWTTDFTFSYAKNTITKLQSRSTVMNLVQSSGFAKEGYPQRAIFSIPFVGLNSHGIPQFLSPTGEVVTTDINFQDWENTGYLKYEGPVDAPYTGGFGNNVTWRGFHLNVFLTYAFGNKVRLTPTFAAAYSDLTAMPKEFKNRWVMPGDEAYTDVPVIASRRQYYADRQLSRAYSAYNYSTARVAKGDFIRLKEVSVTYDIPAVILHALKLTSASVKLATTNLCLLYADKKLNGQDPEFFNSGGVASPNPKQFTFTLRFGL